MVDCNVEFAGLPSPTTTSVSQPSLLGSSIQQQTHFSAVVLTSELIHTLGRRDKFISSKEPLRVLTVRLVWCR